MTEQYVYGIHAVALLLKNRLRPTTTLYLCHDRVDEKIEALSTEAEKQQIALQRLSLKEMNQRFPNMVHQGVVAAAGKLPTYIEKDLDYLLGQSRKPSLILILDGITDPHNLGACLRSADAAGVDFVIIPKDKNATVTGVVSKVASGATESVPLIRVTNLSRTMENLKEQGVWIYGAAGEASNTLYDLDYKTSIAIVMGAEGKGLRHLTRERCDSLFSIPMHGAVSSLNVSVATGICLYEIVRQRG